MDHDQRFKALLHEFLPSFFALFFPQWSDRFDFSDPLWLEQELFSDPPQGERRAVDLVVQLPVLVPPNSSASPGDRWLVLVHIEVESAETVAPLRQRIARYHHFLRWKHELPVLSIGLYLRVGLDGIGWDVYEESFWAHPLVHFEYPYIGLPALDGEHYVTGENLLGVALAALMRLPQDRRLELGEQALRRPLRSQENDYRRYLLCECVDAYIPIDPAQRAELEERLATTGSPEESVKFVSIFEKYKQAGLLEGRQEGLRESLIRVLERRFGPLAPEVRAQVARIAPEQLPSLLDAAVVAPSLEDVPL